MLEQIIKLNKNNSISVYKPSECNYCNKGVDLIFCDSFIAEFYSESILCVSYKCPVCQQIIICKYNLSTLGYSNMFNSPIPPFETLGGEGISKEFSNEINKVSPSFVKIFNDAYRAEQIGLTEVVGLGYRRSFEFLIKDYAISQEIDETKRKNIKKMQLSQVVNTYFPNGKIKEIITRATWIGNDFAHYETKHSDINLEDLKQLILLSASRIDESLKIKKYIEKVERK